MVSESVWMLVSEISWFGTVLHILGLEQVASSITETNWEMDPHRRMEVSTGTARLASFYLANLLHTQKTVLLTMRSFKETYFIVMFCSFLII